MKVLVIGSNGQLGTELCKQLSSGISELGAIPAVYKDVEVFSADIPEIDITNQNSTIAYIEARTVDIVFNCAAYTNVDGCELHEDDAFRVNAIGARNLAIACERTKAKLLHVSTDYVFPGNGIRPYREDDQPNPISAYGRTKLAGEQNIIQFCSRWFIIRTAWLYGYYGRNFVKAILNKALSTGKVTVVNDQRGNPTNAADLAYHMLKIAVTTEYGIYHCTGTGECSWFDFAKSIVTQAQIAAEVVPCTSDDYPSPTKRPAYSSLEHMMLRLTVGDEMRSWEDALRCYIDNLEQQSKKEG